MAEALLPGQTRGYSLWGGSPIKCICVSVGHLFSTTQVGQDKLFFRTLSTLGMTQK